MFTLRFDMRAPHGAAPATDLYGAATDMCEWAETRGAVLAVLSEHHGADDGHLPVPLTLAELREDGGPYRIFTPDEVIAHVRGGQLLPLAPLCGGVAPAVAWPYLERAAAAFAEDQ
jgi:hypothetical protein